MNIKIDLSDITLNLVTEVNKTIEAIDQEVALDAALLLVSVQEDTPVETGRAKAGWEIEKESPDVTVVKNDVEYIGFLDEGTSHHAGNHMVDKAIQKVGNR